LGGEGFAVAALAVFVSVGCGSDFWGSDLARVVRAAVWAGFAAGALDFALDAEASAEEDV
jgi:hypothetical protein